MRAKFEENNERRCDKNLGITESGRLILISPTCLGQPLTDAAVINLTLSYFPFHLSDWCLKAIKRGVDRNGCFGRALDIPMDF